MQNRNILIAGGIFLAIVLFVGGYVYFTGQGTALAPSDGVTQEVPAPGAGDVEEMIVEPQEAREIEVSGDEYSFSPSSITATAGERLRVTFKNTGKLSHNFTIAELGVATKTISPGQSDTVEFTVEGEKTLTFYCSVGSHRSLGMEGDLELSQ